MKKVLFVATVDSHILHFHIPYLKLFKENGYEVHVATNGNEKIPYCDKKYTIPIERSPYKLRNIKAIKQLKEIIDNEKYDIIHCHTPMGSVVTRLAARKARKKYHTRVIYTAHGFHFYKGAPTLNWILFYPVEKYLAKYTDTLITINNEDYELAKKKFKRRCKDIQYVPGVGIDTKKFDIKMTEKEKNELRKSLGLKKDDFVMIYPAELSQRKRQIWLINAISDLMKKYKSIHLLLPGKDSLNGECQNLINDLNLSNQIHLLGYRNDIQKLLRISNISISTAKQEGLPVNIMEAMYIGLPIVASDCRGNRDLVKDGVNGYLIELNDDKKFKNRIEKIYKSEEIALKFSGENKKIIDDYLLDKIILLMLKIYKLNLLESKVSKIAIITSGFLPVPASKGGAAENLIDTFVAQNEINGKVWPVIFSSYDFKAYDISKKIKNSQFIFIKPNRLALLLDRLNYFVIDKVLKNKNSRKFRYFFQRLDFFYKCSKYLKNNNYDKILLENHTIMYLVLKWNNNYKKYKNKYYYHCHNVVPSKYGMDKIIQNTNKFISVSEFRNRYVKEFFDVSNDKCKVVLNCCSKDIYNVPTKIEMTNLKKKYKITNEKVILYIGRIDKDKGTLELIKACNKISKINFKLIIVGAPIFAIGITTEYEKEVKKEVLANKDKYIMTGYVNHDELYKYYGIADVVAVPSQVDDSAPLVIIESLISGKAIVATNSGGIPEYVNDKCSILIEKDDEYVNNLAKSLEKVITDDNLKKKMATESLKQSNLFKEEVYYNKFVDELLD